MIKRLLTALLLVCTLSVAHSQTDDPLQHKHFAWGADLGSTIDMSSQDMSSINIEAFFGYRGPLIDLMGAGAAINMMMNNDSRSIPVFAIFRSNITRNSLWFADIRVGCAFNSIYAAASTPAFYCSPGIGFKLASSANFKSYLILSYIYNGADLEATGTHKKIAPLSMANLRLGITF